MATQRTYRDIRAAQSRISAVQHGDLRVPAVLAGDHLRAALPPDVAGRAAARRRHHRGAQRADRGDLAEAQKLKDESDAAIAAYEKSLADARARAQALAARDPRQADGGGRERRKALEAKLNAKLAEAEKTIAATKTAAMTNVRAIADEAARRSSSG